MKCQYTDCLLGHFSTTGTDFDFAKNTHQVAPALKKEEELYIKQSDHSGECQITALYQLNVGYQSDLDRLTYSLCIHP
jgi:hypothetical protein